MIPPAVKMDAKNTFSKLEDIRRKQANLVPAVLANVLSVKLKKNEALGAVSDHNDIKNKFPKTYGCPRVTLVAAGPECAGKPLRMGVVLSGGQAPGGHNVIAGIFDFCKKVHPHSALIGFLNGPHGIFTGNFCEIDEAFMDAYRNIGGFDMIGSGRHKIDKAEDFASSLKYATALKLDGLVVIGGDDSNTNAAILGEYFAAHGSDIKVCGCPKTIDGDLKVHPYIPTSFGFDTACRTYSELIGNLGQDTLSSQKYYHFVRLMGRSASHIALECALQTRPNMCLVGEEVNSKNMTLQEVSTSIVDMICERSTTGKDYGIVLVPEGIIEFIPEFNALISEITDMGELLPHTEMAKRLSPANRAVFDFLPVAIKEQLCLDRDPHGNVQVTKIETEKLLAMTVAAQLDERRSANKYAGSFSPQFHSFGYEGRSGLPSHFDSTYCYVLGMNVAALVSLGQNGLISSITDLDKPVSEWQCGGVPITMMCNMERRHSKMKPVIKKALVDLNGLPFKTFAQQRKDWSKYDLYRSPGPLQFFKAENCSTCELSITLQLELAKKDPRMSEADLSAAKKAQDNSIEANLARGFTYCPFVGPQRRATSVSQRERMTYKPHLCPSLVSPQVVVGESTQSKLLADRGQVAARMPFTYGAQMMGIHSGGAAPSQPTSLGVVFLGRQAPGGHDVLAGLFDALSPGSTLFGFVGGSKGLIRGNSVKLTADIIDSYRGQGGFELLGRSVDRLAGAETLAKIESVCSALKLDGLTIIGGARTVSDFAMLAEYLKAKQSRFVVTAVPVDISGALTSNLCEVSVGFDTASKVAAQVVGNNATDGASAKKYYYFMRMMGGEQSHVTLEVALATKPNYVILSEEVRLKKMTLQDITNSIADLVAVRAAAGKNYGTVIIPEGLIESSSELNNLCRELDAILKQDPTSTPEQTVARLTVWSRALYETFPVFTQKQLLMERTSADSLSLSQVETEKLFLALVEAELKRRTAAGSYSGKFSAIASFVGYQTRGAAPTNFDVTLAYNLGATAVALMHAGCSGYMAVVYKSREAVANWCPSGVPASALLCSRMKHMKHANCDVGVPTHPVDLSSSSYQELANNRYSWMVADRYENPGPVQFFGPNAESRPATVVTNQANYHTELVEVESALEELRAACKPGCDGVVLKIAHRSIMALADSVKQLQKH